MNNNMYSSLWKVREIFRFTKQVHLGCQTLLWLQQRSNNLMQLRLTVTSLPIYQVQYTQQWLQEKPGFSLTCLQSDASRLRLLVEMVRLIVIPANCRLLFPSMDVRQREVGCKGTGTENKIFSLKQVRIFHCDCGCISGNACVCVRACVRTCV